MNNRKQLDMSRNERFCRICDEGVIGDEFHFVFECSKLEDFGIKYMALRDRMRPNVYNVVHICYRTMIQTQSIAWQNLHCMV